MSERTSRRAERVRRALTEWDEQRGVPELKADRVAEMRAAVLRAAVAVERTQRSDGSGLLQTHGLRLALALAPVVLLLLVWLGVRIGRQAVPSGPAVAERTTESAPSPSPRDVSEPGAEAPGIEIEPEEPVVADLELDVTVPRSAAPQHEPLVVATLEDPPLPPTPPSDPVGGEAETTERRVRHLQFQAPSGRKIHWILDSEFRGAGDRE